MPCASRLHLSCISPPKASILMRIKLSLRNTFFTVFVLSTALMVGIAASLRFNYLSDSPLLFLQCYGLAACCCIALTGAVHNSQGRTRRMYALLMLTAICLSIGAAVVQSRPERHVSFSASAARLGANLPFAAPLQRLLMPVDQTQQEAGSQVAPHESMPVVLFGYSALALFAFWQTCRKTPERRRFG